MSIWDDTFTGSNGDPPDPTKWEVVQNTNDAYKIESNALTLNYNLTPYAPEDTYVDIRGKYFLTGDFDIETAGVRYQIGSSGTVSWYTIEVVSEDDTMWAGVGYLGGSGTPTYGFFACDDTGAGAQHNLIAYYQDTDQVKLRITRSGSTISVFRWSEDNSRWEGAYNDTGGWITRSISGNVRVRLAAFVGVGRRAYWMLDYFTINSGTSEVIPESGIAAESVGVESETDAGGIYSAESGSGPGVSSECDALSPYVDSDSNPGIRATAEVNIEYGDAVLWQTDPGVSAEIDSWLATDGIDSETGIQTAADGDYLTKSISDFPGINSAIDSFKEIGAGSTESPGVADLIDAYNFTEWQRSNLGRAKKTFELKLTGANDATTDVTLPMASFQARKRSGSPTYLSTVIRDYSFSSAIAARQNGELVIEVVYRTEGVESLREEIIRVTLDDITFDIGPKSRAITLSGYKTTTFASKSITLSNSVYSRVSSGLVQHRFADVDIFANPGDELTVGTDTFTIGNISYFITPGRQQMDVFEAAA